MGKASAKHASAKHASVKHALVVAAAIVLPIMGGIIGESVVGPVLYPMPSGPVMTDSYPVPSTRVESLSRRARALDEYHDRVIKVADRRNTLWFWGVPIGGGLGVCMLLALYATSRRQRSGSAWLGIVFVGVFVLLVLGIRWAGLLIHHARVRQIAQEHLNYAREREQEGRQEFREITEKYLAYTPDDALAREELANILGRRGRYYVSAVLEGNNQVALDLYANLRGEKADNLVFSPYSISTALAMTYAGARGETEKEMAQVLHFRVPQDRLPLAFAALMAKPRSEKEGNQLRIANRLWGQQGYQFLPEFLQVTREQYKAELALQDFVTKPEEARTTINNWVENQTEEKIKDLIPPGVLTQLTRLVLTSAIYFKGKWAGKFDKRATREAPFRLTPVKTVSVPMMYRKDGFEYGTVDDAQILELPYVGNELSMLIVLPQAVDGLAELEKRLTSATMERWLSVLRRQEVNVYLPRFTVTSQFQMNEVLKSMGMPSAFSPDAADFSGMDGKRDLFISAVIHKAFVDVNEDGTEAAAATGVAGPITSIQITPDFRADHPFVFLIRETRTGAILFVGRVVNPKG